VFHDEYALSGQMKISANTAVKSQLSTLPQSDQYHVTSVLSNLLAKPIESSYQIKRIPDGRDLFMVRITSRLRALVRINRDEDQIELIAIARPDQIEPYLKDVRS
jgi:hypothetical protein